MTLLRIYDNNHITIGRHKEERGAKTTTLQPKDRSRRAFQAYPFLERTRVEAYAQ